MQSSDVSFFLRKRYLMVLLTWFGMLFMFILRTNLSIAIVEMTSEKKITFNNQTFTKKADFDWDTKVQGFVLSSFSIGYLFGPVGGMLGLKFGGVQVYGFGLAVTGLLTALSPFSLRINFWLFILSRILEGIFESFSMTCAVDIFVRWAPPHERSRLLPITLAGALVGVMINYPLCGFLAYRYSWEYIFYATGSATLIWYIFWFSLAVDDPTADVFMTQTEREYFKTFVSEDLRKVRDIRIYPWKKIFTCRQFWIYLNEVLTYFWTYSFIMYYFPLYVHDAFNINIQDVGFISGIPTLFGVVGLIGSAYLSDYLRSHGRFTKSCVHKFFIGTGQLASAVCFILVATWANYEQSIICFALAKLLIEFSDMSYHVLVIDLFHKYAALVRGWGVSVTGLAFFLNPIMMGFIISDHSKSSWNLYFMILSAFNIWSIIIYYCFGAAETLDWVTNEADDKTDEPQMSEIIHCST